MSYRKFNADNLFDGYRFLGQGQVLITDEKGKIAGIVPASEAGDDVEKLEGILSPGLVNCHCHLELSHLKDVIPPHTGLIEFLCSVVTKREALPNASEGGAYEDPEIKKMRAITAAENEMYTNGIVAVGDIGNTADTAGVKSKSKIRWQNFVEVLGFTDEKAEENILHYKSVLNELENTPRSASNIQRSSLVPHAPYSISPKTFELINNETNQKIISIHNQEHPAEDVLYKTGGGEYLKLFKIFGIEKSPFPITKKSSLQSYLPHFTNGQTIFLIHNTFMPEEDIVFANEYAAAKGLKLVYCLCPNANLYIENRMPSIENFIKHNCHIVLGTDSYSSNWQLSIAKEIQSVHQYFQKIEVEKILQWATIDGAKALQWDNELGSFEKDKTPGVTLIHHDFASSKKIL
ncbi:MAG: amidohydrolase family protein [Bacteroidota bacterium]